MILLNCGVHTFMAGLDFLGEIKQEVDGFVVEWMRKEREAHSSKLVDWSGKEREMVELMWEKSTEFVTRGKGVRGGLVALGYQLTGKDWHEVVPIAAGVEMMHSFLLVHDDIMDKDVMRRGHKTMHVEMGDRVHAWANGEHGHLGLSLGMLMGDLLNFWGWRMWQAAKLPEAQLWRGKDFWYRTMIETGYGQVGDVLLPYEEKITEGLILRMYEQKTGKYTISGPLVLGALIGGIEEERKEAMESYGNKVGVAFQLADDDLGLYGNGGQTGKGVGTDVREGKMTLMRLKTFELGNEEQRRIFEVIYRKDEVHDEDIFEVLRITTESGARDYVRKLSTHLVAEAKSEVMKITDDARLQLLLKDLADYMINRRV